jgi:SAM-dependent methyltransferase
MNNNPEQLDKVHKSVYHMGIKTSDVFRGKSESGPVREIYGESAKFFSEIIRSKFTTDKKHSLLDIGSAKGELVSEMLGYLPEYEFDITATDTNPDAINENPAKNKIVADAESLPINDQSIDIVLMRYVLQFNSLNSQENILKEVQRVTKEIAIVQHGGADSVDLDGWRSNVDQIFHSSEFLPLNRDGILYLSQNEIEFMMNKNNIRYERIQSRRIEGLSQAFIERYCLNENQSKLIKDILGDRDYIMQTTWIVYPKGR